MNIFGTVYSETLNERLSSKFVLLLGNFTKVKKTDLPQKVFHTAAKYSLDDKQQDHAYLIQTKICQNSLTLYKIRRLYYCQQTFWHLEKLIFFQFVLKHQLAYQNSSNPLAQKGLHFQQCQLRIRRQCRCPKLIMFHC